jgi:Tannase and feruloyl esterase
MTRQSIIALTLAGLLTFIARPLGAAQDDTSRTVSEAGCSVARLGDSIDVARIGEPVAAVTLSAPQWSPATGNGPAYCSVDGVMAPVDTSETAQPINFRVALPAEWSGRAAQLGGGGINGSVPNLTGEGPLAMGFATYGSDSGHQIGGFGGFAGGRGRGARGGGGRPAAPAPNPSANDWALNDEAIRNLGYMQMKKTHDAAMVLIERMYGELPEFNYYIGGSQGGREALTVAERYPDDYDGIAANVPIVNFSSLMLAPELIRIQEKPLENWVTAAKVNAIRGEFMRQCDGLDGLTDGVINNYMACREAFDTTDSPGPSPWAAKRCPNNVDPNPGDTSPDACLTDGQISTLEFIYRPYVFASPLAHGVDSFGMWVPNTDPSGSGLIANARFRGQKGAGDDAPMHSHLGVLGVTGFLMQDLEANPLDYVEGGQLEARRQELSEWLDGTDPNLSAFRERGGKMIVAIGTNDTLASPGSQLDFYQSVIDTMGREAVDDFARLFVLPQTGHGLSGSSYEFDGDGRARESFPIPNGWDRLAVLRAWVEDGVKPAMALTVSAGERSLPLCSYPTYPRYRGGPESEAGSYECTRP